MRIIPRTNHILVERIETEHKSGSIIIPDVATNKAMVCKVLAVGPGRWEDGVFTKTVVKSGDIVLVPGWGGQYADYEFPDGSILIQEGDVGGIMDGIPSQAQYRKPEYV